MGIISERLLPAFMFSKVEVLQTFRVFSTNNGALSVG